VALLPGFPFAQFARPVWAKAGRTFDISPDGKRLLMIKNVGGGGTTERPSIVVVSHWFDEVKARMGSK
jgi:hypothetical protein